MSKYTKYLWYVIRHKYYVFIECCKLWIPIRGLLHDISKLRPDEFIPYAKYFYGYWIKENEWHGDIRNYYPYELTEMYINQKFDLAWLHHQKRNPHHWQYWLLQEDDGKLKVLDMPIEYKKEMLADWRGVGKAINGLDDTKNWYIKNKDKMILHENTRKWVEEQLNIE